MNEILEVLQLSLLPFGLLQQLEQLSAIVVSLTGVPHQETSASASGNGRSA